MTSCQDAQRFIHAYLDGELDEREGAGLQVHLEICGRCRRMAEFEERFREGLRRSLKQETAASAGLRARVGLGLEQVKRAADTERESWLRRWAWRLIPAAAAVGLVVAVAVSRRADLSPLSSLAEDSIEWHRRQMAMDVTDPSPERVQQFFADKVPFVVRPPSFAAGQRARLVGARLTNLREHQAVTLIYRVGDTRVSVFVFDPTAMPAGGQVMRVGPREVPVHWEGRRGYNVALYRQGGAGYAVTSEMDPQNMVQLISHSR